MSDVHPSIYMYCGKCNVKMTCLGIDEVSSDGVAITYYCEKCGNTVRMVILYID